MGLSSNIVVRLERLAPLQLALLIGLVAQLLFTVDLGQPAKMMFDETHYVPAAGQTFGLIARGNEEHPLLAKWLIGLSMALFGETPAGWRALSTLMGTATVLAIFWIAFRLFGSARAAATAAVLTMFNQLVFIHARIAMLEVYWAAFVLLAIGCMIEGYRSPNPRRWLLGAAVLLGLAIGSKWSAIPWAGGIGLAFVAMKLRGRGWPGVSLLTGGALLGLVGAAVYLLSFTPALFYADEPIRLGDLFAYQCHMFDLQTQVLAPHNYQSDWWSWPLIVRPIWYLYEQVEGVQRGVLLAGNPAIMWGGLVAVAACLWSRERPLLIAAGLWAFAYGVLVLIPKKIGFYYYYYLPGTLLSLALTGAFQHHCSKRRRWVPAGFLILSAALFLYFHPIISAGALPDEQAFQDWIWFPTWP